MVVVEFAGRGWAHFPAEPASSAWAAAALSKAHAVLSSPRDDWRAGGTWFVGVDALDNDPDGAVARTPLAGQAVAEVARLFGRRPWHRAQLSVIRPGYPQPSAEETPAAFLFRLKRDAAHVDGLIAEGSDKRRFVREPHAFILGLALNATTPDASPLAVWEGSHKIMRDAFRAAFAGTDPNAMDQADVTGPYQEARREVFRTCPRRLIHLAPGEAVLIDRHLLHGVSPWVDSAEAPPEGRIIAYFRPQCASVAEWLEE